MSLLEYEIQPHTLERREITHTQVEKGLALLAPLFGQEIAVEPCELTAIHGLISGQHPVDWSDSDLRYEIIQSNRRYQEGSLVDERHLGLFIIKKMLQEVDFDSIDS